MRNFSAIAEGLEKVKSSQPKMEPSEMELWQEIDIKGYGSTLSILEMYAQMAKDYLIKSDRLKASEYLGFLKTEAQDLIARIEKISLTKFSIDESKNFPLDSVEEIKENVPQILQKIICKISEALSTEGTIAESSFEDIDGYFKLIAGFGAKMKENEQYQKYRGAIAAQGEKGRS